MHLRNALLTILPEIDGCTQNMILQLSQEQKNLERFTNLRVILAQGPC